MRLLVVEDSEDLVQVWRTLFRIATNYKVKFCLSASAAKELVNSGFKPDVVLTDYYLGDSNGIDFISWSRQRIDASYILITGSHEDERILKLQDEGAFVLLQKPVKFNLIKEVIEAIAQGRQRAQALSAQVPTYQNHPSMEI